MHLLEVRGALLCQLWRIFWAQQSLRVSAKPSQNRRWKNITSVFLGEKWEKIPPHFLQLFRAQQKLSYAELRKPSRGEESSGGGISYIYWFMVGFGRELPQMWGHICTRAVSNLQSDLELLDCRNPMKAAGYILIFSFLRSYFKASGFTKIYFCMGIIYHLFSLILIYFSKDKFFNIKSFQMLGT